MCAVGTPYLAHRVICYSGFAVISLKSFHNNIGLYCVSLVVQFHPANFLTMIKGLKDYHD